MEQQFFINNVQQFKQIIHLLKGLSNEINMHFNNDSLTLQCSKVLENDQALLTYCVLNTSKSTFDTLLIKLDVHLLHVCLNNINNETNICLSHSNDTLKITVLKDKQIINIKQIKTLLSDDYIQNFTYNETTNKLTIPSKEFKRIIKDFQTTSSFDKMFVSFEQNKIVLSTKDFDLQNDIIFNRLSPITFKKSNTKDGVIGEHSSLIETFENQYSLSCFAYFSRHCIKISDIVTLSFVNNKHAIVNITAPDLNIVHCVNPIKID